MVLERPGEPLVAKHMLDPVPGPGKIRVRVMDGELPNRTRIFSDRLAGEPRCNAHVGN